MCQVQDLKRKLTGVRRKGRGNDQLRQETGASLPTVRLMEVAEPGHAGHKYPLEGEEVGNDSKAYAVVFEESCKLQAAQTHQRASSPKGARRHDQKFDCCSDVVVDW